jgi:hypothetical protein
VADQRAAYPLVGTIVRRDGDTLTVREEETDRRVSVMLGSSVRIQLGHRVHTASAVLPHTAVGAFVGAVGGALAAPLLTSDCMAFRKELDKLTGCTLNLADGRLYARGAIAGALGGALVGTVVGLVRGVERWENIEHQRITPLIAFGGRSVAVTVRAQF